MEILAPPATVTVQDWAATPRAVQQVLLATLTFVTLQQQQIIELQSRVVELEARLNQHSQNSFKPLSSDPPLAPPPCCGGVATRAALRAQREAAWSALHTRPVGNPSGDCAAAADRMCLERRTHTRSAIPDGALAGAAMAAARDLD